jgi:hypothetical protein
MSSLWEKMYEHDGTGNKISGDLEGLFSAANRGADIRIGYSTLDGSIQWTREADVVILHPHAGGGRRDVYAIVTGIADTVSDIRGRRMAIPLVYEWHAFGSNGSAPHVERNRQTHEIVAESEANVSVSWFVRDNWIETYHHDHRGDPSSGSLNSLINKIAAGCDVKIRHEDQDGMLRTFACRSVAISNNIVSCLVIDIPEFLAHGDIDLERLEWRSHHTSGLREVTKLDPQGAFIRLASRNSSMWWYTRGTP